MGVRNRVKLNIAGCEIKIGSDDNESYIRETGALVDEHIRKVMEQTPNMSTTLAAIFAALDFCDEANKERKTADNLRDQLKSYFDDAAAAREQLQQSRKSEEDAREELKALKTLNGLKALQEQQKTDDK